MKSQTAAKLLATPIAIIALGILWSDRGHGQIVPDNTLGPESSLVRPAAIDGIDSQRIDGGAVRGANLFHSFSEFNVNSGAAAYFANPGGIENILSRVTGGNISNIFGTLGVLGNANLFLINPAGIVFGPQSRLDLGGSFVGSTAEAIVFGNGFEFSATNPQAPPLLTINIPVGLNLRQNNGTIKVEGTVNPDVFPTEVSTGLAVAPGKTLALVGSDVTLTDAIVTAPSGRIEIGSVLDGSVSLTQSISGWELGYSQVESFGEIKLLETSSVFNPNIIPNPSAGIFVNGGKVRLDGRSQIASLTVADSPGSNIVINAAETVEIGGVDENIFPFSSWVVNQVAPEATGKGGDITVTTPTLSIRDGGRIQTISLGAGAAGNIEVNADNIELNGFSPISSSLPVGLRNILDSRIASENSSTGPGGNINISTRQLHMKDGGQVLSQVGPDATGAGGTIVVNASQLITGIGVNPFNRINGISSNSVGRGKGGDILVSTPKLTLDEGARILSLATGSGRGGDIVVNATESIEAMETNPFFPVGVSGIVAITVGPADSGELSISTQKLRLSSGATLGSTVLLSSTVRGEPLAGSGSGKGGNLTVNATESIEVIGTGIGAASASDLGTDTLGEGNAGDTVIYTQRLMVSQGGQILTNTFAQGNAGRLTINATERIVVSSIGVDVDANLSEVSASARRLSEGERQALFLPEFPSGNTGELTINTPHLMVSNGGRVIVEHQGTGDAGVMEINASEVSLDRGGSISAQTVSGQGGNIILNVPDSLQLRNDSAITVEAGGTGNGGNLTINSDTIALLSDSNITANAVGGNGGNIGITARGLFISADSQITASSQFGVDGVVEVKTPDNDPTQGLLKLPDRVVDAAEAIDLDPCNQGRDSEFIITGRGGLPPNPNQDIITNTARASWIEPVQSNPGRSPSQTPDRKNSEQISSASIVPARGWIFQPDGSVRLVGYDPTGTSASGRFPQAQRCGSD